jgi:hypothetical protein
VYNVLGSESSMASSSIGLLAHAKHYEVLKYATEVRPIGINTLMMRKERFDKPRRPRRRRSSSAAEALVYSNKSTPT